MKDLGEKVLAAVGGVAILGALFLVPHYGRKHDLEKLHCREVPVSMSASNSYVCDKDGDGRADTLRHYLNAIKAPEYIDSEPSKALVEWYAGQE